MNKEIFKTKDYLDKWDNWQQVISDIQYYTAKNKWGDDDKLSALKLFSDVLNDVIVTNDKTIINDCRQCKPNNIKKVSTEIKILTTIKS